jgi:hypothetical protein
MPTCAHVLLDVLFDVLSPNGPWDSGVRGGPTLVSE